MSEQFTMTAEQIHQAIAWYAQGIDLVTIGQHSGVQWVDIARNIRSV